MQNYLQTSKNSSTFARRFEKNALPRAALAELVDAPDLGSGSSQSVGSSPICRTKIYCYEKVHFFNFMRGIMPDVL